MSTKVIALLGESGTGKDTIKARLCEKTNVFPIVRHTTRPIRDGETNGNPYYFMKQIPPEWIIEDRWMEIVKYNDWVYMTHEDMIMEDATNVGCYDQDSVEQMYMSCQEKGYDFVCFRIIVPPKERLLRQLLREEEPNVNEIVRRYMSDTKDYENLDLPFKTFPILNLDLEKAIQMIEYII